MQEEPRPPASLQATSTELSHGQSCQHSELQLTGFTSVNGSGSMLSSISRPQLQIVSDSAVELTCSNAEVHHDDQAEGERRYKKPKREPPNRAKTGCLTCRKRRKKCDERKPTCGKCENLGVNCEGYDEKAHGTTKQAARIRPRTQQIQPSSESYDETSSFLPTGYWRRPDMGHRYTHGRHKASDTLLDSTHRPQPDSWPHHNWHAHPAAPLPSPPAPGPYYHNRLHAECLILPPLPHIHPANHHPRHVLSSTLPGSECRQQPQLTFEPHMNRPMAPAIPPQLVERDRMLRGQTYMHYTDPILVEERQSCTQALARFNDAGNTARGISIGQRREFLTQILQPRLRTGQEQTHHNGPNGEIGEFTIVETPFDCDYGYHIHLGREVVISSHCYLQDGGPIFIGDRVMIGSHTKLLTMTVSMDPNVRAGSQSRVEAGSIWIGDDAFIGAGAIVFADVRIGRRAVVGAGSVVTQDVPENTVVAGNPAKHIREIDNAVDHQNHPHRMPQIDAQEERAVIRMGNYANNGWKLGSGQNHLLFH